VCCSRIGTLSYLTATHFLLQHTSHLTATHKYRIATHIYTLAHTHTHIHIYTHTHAHTLSHTRTPQETHTHSHTHIRTHTHTKTHTYTYNRLHTPTHAHTNTPAHAHPATHAHTHIHTHRHEHTHNVCVCVCVWHCMCVCVFVCITKVHIVKSISFVCLLLVSKSFSILLWTVQQKNRTKCGFFFNRTVSRSRSIQCHGHGQYSSTHRIWGLPKKVDGWGLGWPISGSPVGIGRLGRELYIWYVQVGGPFRGTFSLLAFEEVPGPWLPNISVMKQSNIILSRIGVVLLDANHAEFSASKKTAPSQSCSRRAVCTTLIFTLEMYVYM